MPTATIHPLDGRQAVIVDPDEIRSGDWMRDCGRLRLVVSVESTDDSNRPGATVHFADVVEDRFATLTVPAAIGVTVWRTPVQVAGARCV
jgi:hypothetical protein